MNRHTWVWLEWAIFTAAGAVLLGYICALAQIVSPEAVVIGFLYGTSWSVLTPRILRFLWSLERTPHDR